MAVDIVCIKRADHSLVGATQEGIESLQKLKVGMSYGITLTQARKGGYHRRLFSLLKFAYDNTDVPEVLYEGPLKQFDGQMIKQSFTSFRRGLVIMAGFYTLDVQTNGDLRFEAQSLSYDKCSQELVEQIYPAVLTVITEKVFNGSYTEKRLDEINSELCGYMGDDI